MAHLSVLDNNKALLLRVITYNSLSLQKQYVLVDTFIAAVEINREI